MYYKGYKVRIYPTKEQEALIWKHINCCRFIWNYMIDLQHTRYKNKEKHLSNYEMGRYVTVLAKNTEYSWLKEVSLTSLRRTCETLSIAYSYFFKGEKRYPNFKSKKKAKKNYPVRCDRFYFEDDFAYIEKIGRIKYKSDFELPKGRKHKFTNVYITFVNGKYMLSFGIACEKQTHTTTNELMGIDLGIKDLAVVAFGQDKIVFTNINKSRRIKYLKRKIVHTQRSIFRKYRYLKNAEIDETKNLKKEIEKIRKLYARLTNIRHNYIHQTTAKLISLSPKRVTMESLNVRDMMRDRHLSGKIFEQCFSRFIEQMKYKCEWNGIEFVQADRFYPSSKTCSNCGKVNRALKLSERTFTCPCCNYKIDRDYNAAINLMRYEA